MKNEDDVADRETGDSPILKEEVEKAVEMLKDGKSPGLDNNPAEILKHGWPSIIDRDRRMSENMDQWIVAQRLDKVTVYSYVAT